MKNHLKSSLAARHKEETSLIGMCERDEEKILIRERDNKQKFRF
jgi:hypothetical protein